MWFEVNVLNLNIKKKISMNAQKKTRNLKITRGTEYLRPYRSYKFFSVNSSKFKIALALIFTNTPY